MDARSVPDDVMARAITRSASRQTDLTIRYLVDPGMVADAYRAYGYFRWVDDWLDVEIRSRQERLSFVNRQKKLMEMLYRGEVSEDLATEEVMLANLIANDREPNSGLQSYIRNMMAVMALDAERRGRLISESELHEYTHLLAVAVTEALHHFVGHCCSSPHDKMRYMAVTGAHITHMLRDTLEDADAGYYNIPHEVMTANQITPWDVDSSAYRGWVRERVRQARECFRIGSEYLAKVENLRCRLAGFAYMRRFQVVLDSIEWDGFVLRRQYPERKERGRGIEILATAAWMALRYRRFPPTSSISMHQV
jgi:phytoene/squalene synthetase